VIPQAGDIVGVRGSGWLADHICVATKGRISHVGLVISTTPVLVIEALMRVKTNPWTATIAGAQSWHLYRPKTLTQQQIKAVIYRAVGFTAESYGFLDIGLQGLDAITRSRFFTGHLAGLLWLRSHPICSYVVAKSFDDALHLRFGVAGDDSITPADIDVFCVSHPELYEVA
jgi:hypothetical protein